MVGIIIAITVGIGLIVTSSKLLSGSAAVTNNNSDKPMVIHVHPHLSIDVNGQPITIPENVGIDSSIWKNHSLDNYGMQAMAAMGMDSMAPLHTHDNSGVIHVESSTNRNYTLGEFLSVWGGLDLNGKIVKATVDGKSAPDYKNIVLNNDGEQIKLQITQK